MSQEQLSTYSPRTDSASEADYLGSTMSCAPLAGIGAENYFELDTPDSQLRLSPKENARMGTRLILGAIAICAFTGIAAGASSERHNAPKGVAWTSSRQLLTDAQRAAIMENVQNMHCTGPFRGKNSHIRINNRRDIELSGAIAPKRKAVISLTSVFEAGVTHIMPSSSEDARALVRYCTVPRHISAWPRSLSAGDDSEIYTR